MVLLDPARALRRGVRSKEEAKVERLIEWLLWEVPLMWEPHDHSVSCRIIRGAASALDDGFAFEFDEQTHTILSIHRADEVPVLGVGDKIATVDGRPISAPLHQVVKPESVAELGIWKMGAMKTCRKRLARASLSEALIEVS